MPRMIVSIDSVVIKEVELTKERTTLGRRPYNDIVIDNLAVSGEHAVIHMADDGVEIEDVGSTNGTYVNAKAVTRQELRNGDIIEVGKYKIRFLQEAGREVALSKVVTTIGKPGVAVASITKRHQGHVLAHVEGPDRPLLNGTPMGEAPVPLKHGDRITLAGTEMQFEQG